jgi:hypothetical protein
MSYARSAWGAVVHIFGPLAEMPGADYSRTAGSSYFNIGTRYGVGDMNDILASSVAERYDGTNREAPRERLASVFVK